VRGAARLVEIERWAGDIGLYRRERLGDIEMFGRA
jgi:hypothetical protein